MFPNLLTFSIIDTGNDDDSVASSWVFSDSPDRLSWFSLQLGYKPLLLVTKPWHGKGTLLHWMLAASDDGKRAYHDGLGSLHRVPAHWLRLRGLNLADKLGESIFHEPLRVLAEVRVLEPVAANYFLHLTVVGSYDFEFRDLLDAENGRAMWVFPYWLGLCCRFEHWWMRNRVRRDHRARSGWGAAG